MVDRRNEKVLSFLHRHILHKRNSAKKELEENSIANRELLVNRPDPIANIQSNELAKKNLSERSDLHVHGCDKSRETEKETSDDIGRQIKDLKMKLESLREKKHDLFQQLKAVLHEEDERKRLREEEHKEALDKSDIMDPRLSQVTVGIKRSLPVSPPVMTQGNQTTPAKKTHRVPLLPTPDTAGGGSTVAPFVRQGSGGSFHPPVTESYHSGAARQHYNTPTPFQAGHRSHLDQRFGISNQMSQEMHSQGMSLMTYQFTPGPGPMPPYSPVSNITQASQLSYQPVVQQGFVQPHISEIPMQGQPPPHMFGRPHPQADLKWQQGPPHYLPQGGPGNQLYSDHQHSNSGFATHVQDPRHQKLHVVHDHQRSASVLSSPNPLQSPPVQESQANIMNSPSSPAARDRAKK